MKKYFLFGILALGVILGTSSFVHATISNTKHIKTFHYQLQDAKFTNLKNVQADVFVVDIDDASLTKSQIQSLQKQGKIILSYLSIGEAEDYRGYWKEDWEEGSPAFLDEENPNWEGNFKVKYWEAGWQKIILKRVDEIAKAGYDGVYLDIIDAYEYYEEEGRATAARDMINFVAKINKKGKIVNPNFLVVPQNSPELYKYAAYKKVVDGFGKEDLWYNDDDKQTTKEKNTALKYLRKAKQDGKFILSIDYPEKQKNICDFYKKCQAECFACTVSNRDLDESKPVTCK